MELNGRNGLFVLKLGYSLRRCPRAFRYRSSWSILSSFSCSSEGPSSMTACATIPIVFHYLGRRPHCRILASLLSSRTQSKLNGIQSPTMAVLLGD